MKSTGLIPMKADFAKIGLRCGVEIHQQLHTERKLFCRCPAGLYDKHYDAQVLRHMRPTLSELGEYDGTALMEFKKKKNIMYLLNRRSVCTYEMDDTPPFEINREAVDIALEIALALGCQIVGELHVIRKQYLDGSIPTGFQRTAIVGVNGTLPFRGRQIDILQVSVEEDSCREVSDSGHEIVFRTDRLSMPLAEVVTGPDIRTPQEAAEVVRLIGRVMRSTGRVRRGAGATRQDVNVSAEGGTRVEIKGVPSISLIPELVAGEAVRQRVLLDLQERLTGLGLQPSGFQFRPADVGYLFSGTDSSAIRRSLEANKMVKALRLDSARDVLSTAIGPYRTFAEELAGRVRVIACLDERPILLHDGNYAENSVSDAEWRKVRKKLRARSNDAVVLLRGNEADVDLGCREVVDRMMELFEGVPRETRQVQPHGETDFERILPGPDRMYPDTDSAPIEVPESWLKRLRARLGEPVWQIDERLAQAGLVPSQVMQLATSPRLEWYEAAVREGVSPRRAGWALGEVFAALTRAGAKVESIKRETAIGLLVAQAEAKVPREVLASLLADAAETPEMGPDELIARRGYKPLKDAELAREISAALANVERPRTAFPDARLRYYMGLAMRKLRGNAAGAAVCKAVSDSMGGQL